MNFNYNTPVAIPVSPIVNNTGGGGGGGGGYVPAPVLISSSTTSTTTVNNSSSSSVSIKTKGKVLGVSTFKFTKTLKKGVMSDDVKELQDRLRIEKFFTISSSTRFFGSVTFNAVKKYQKSHGLPSTGFVGPLTIAELNK